MIMNSDIHFGMFSIKTYHMASAYAASIILNTFITVELYSTFVSFLKLKSSFSINCNCMEKCKLFIIQNL